MLIPSSGEQSPLPLPPRVQLPDDIRAGNLQVRLAESPEEVRAAQCLRYRVFYREMAAKPSEQVRLAECDSDEFDPFCDHLLVLEHRPEGNSCIVGTYRLLRRSVMPRIGRFYTADEFDIRAMVNHPGEILELGRSCVDAQFRSRAVMQLLWRGIATYVAMHNIELMFGCASFGGAEPEQHAESLSYLHHYHLAPEELRLTALPHRFVNMDLMPKEAVDARRAFAALPALIKGYLRLGGYVGLGAVIDHDFNTVDVGIVVKTALVTDKYVQRYGKGE